MSALFVIALILLAASAYFVYRRQHALSLRRAARSELLPRPPRSLFPEQSAIDATAPQLPTPAAHGYMEQRAALLARAAAYDLSVLTDAQRTGDAALYGIVLAELVERAALAEDKLAALATYITGHDGLRGSVALAQVYSGLWQQDLGRATTAMLLHLAALADDADTFGKAVEIVRLNWQQGRLIELPAAELHQLLESQYWLMSADARRTGAGFLLKQRLADLRAEFGSGADHGAAAAAPAPTPDDTRP